MEAAYAKRYGQHIYLLRVLQAVGWYIQEGRNKRSDNVKIPDDTEMG
jgi:hypothetical protein